MKYNDLRRTLALLSLGSEYINIKESCHNYGASIDDISQIKANENEIVVELRQRFPKSIKIKRTNKED